MSTQNVDFLRFSRFIFSKTKKIGHNILLHPFFDFLKFYILSSFSFAVLNSKSFVFICIPSLYNYSNWYARSAFRFHL